jgi:hypothetical protein
MGLESVAAPSFALPLIALTKSRNISAKLGKSFLHSAAQTLIIEAVEFCAELVHGSNTANKDQCLLTRLEGVCKRLGRRIEFWMGQ